MVRMHGMMGDFDPEMSLEEFRALVQSDMDAPIDERSVELSYYMNTYLHLLTQINNEARTLVREIFSWATVDGVRVPDEVFASAVKLVSSGIRVGSAQDRITRFMQDQIIESTDMDEVIKRLLD